MTHTITEIQPTKAGRFSLFVDGEFRFSVLQETLVKHHIRKGSVLSGDQLESIRAEDEFASCKAKALRLLASSHSRGMLLDKLTRFYPEETALRTADRMEELGLLDDADYARRCAADLFRLRGWSTARVSAELRKRKLSPALIEQAISEFSQTEPDDTARALALLRKRYAAKLDTSQGVQRTIAALCRQGFAVSDIRRALELLRQEEEEQQYDHQ